MEDFLKSSIQPSLSFQSLNHAGRLKNTPVKIGLIRKDVKEFGVFAEIKIKEAKLGTC